MSFTDKVVNNKEKGSVINTSLPLTIYFFFYTYTLYPPNNAPNTTITPAKTTGRILV